MLTETHLERYADVLIWGLKTARSDRFKKDDIILIRYNMDAIKLAEILFRKLLELGFNPIQKMLGTSTMELDFFNIASNKQIIFQPPGEKELFSNLSGSIFIHAPESITHLSGVDSKKINKSAVARKPLRDILEKRDENGQFGWTLCMFPTPELAKQANISMKDYTNQIIKACYLNRKDPVAQWKEIHKNAQSIKKWLNSLSIKELQICANSFELIVTPGEKRKWIGISGHNIPSFEIFLSPDWRGTRGTYFANQPSYRSGNLVQDVTLKFKNGKVVEMAAGQGDTFLKNQLSMDTGANKIGEFSLTDKRFSKIDRFMADTLYDENYGGKYGNCHVAVGSSYSDTFDGDPKNLTKEKKDALGFNDSALHWDLVNTEKKSVVARLNSGKSLTIYENGQFNY